ncbi:centromere protein J isoform X2 [Salmo trutta]|uniref:Centromere protein J n=2 Tax=Salmo trutta TaxID=8032 RepID=A0A673WPH6_SALTR|nr:centromere protein J-like isoform X2 [Salmo trutta]XP_029567721.1 centromere protein J-like isoform X2 [Salmo trutta]
MASPAGLQAQQCQTNFLARWMPSSSRAVVILNHSLDLAESLRHSSVWGSRDVDDSFASQFLCLSVNSLVHDAESGTELSKQNQRPGDRPLSERQFAGLQTAASQGLTLPGEMDSMEKLVKQSQDLPLILKLEQLRQWQQQLKAHQLEELVRLQEEQQRLLGMVHVAQQDGAGTEAWSSPHEHQLSGNADHMGDNEMEEVMLSPHSAPSMTEECKAYRGDDSELDSQDRPIKQGIEGQKQTFEELLQEELRLEEQRLKTTQQQQSPEAVEGAIPKRVFLRQGEGLSRFTNRSKAPLPNRQRPQKDPKPQGTSEPKPTQRVSQWPPIQRNKANRPRDPCSPPLDSGSPDSKAAQPEAVRPGVLGSHHRQNMVTPDLLRPRDVISNKVGGTSQPVSRTPAAAIKQFGLEERTGALQRNGSGPLRLDGAAEGKPGVVSEYSFELSFQEKLQRWDCDRHKECVELGEFELLERAAEELSFSSNSSFVMKVLQLDQQHPLHGSWGRHPRRLSSTPIKSPKPSPTKGIHSGGTSKSGLGTGTSSSESLGVSAVRAKEVVMREKGKATEEEDEMSDCKQHEEICISFHRSSEFGDQEEVARLPYQTIFPSNPWENTLPTSNPPYDKSSYQDREGGLGQAEGGRESDLDDSILLEDREEGDHKVRLVFDDDDTWNDLEEAGRIVEDPIRTKGAATGNSHTLTVTGNDVSPPERTLKRKVAVAKGAKLERVSIITAANQEPDSPPASQLMARLFPSLKPKTQAPPPPEPRKSENGPGQQLQSSQLRERERFRTENAALARLRLENKNNQEYLRKERAEFEQQKAEELARFEEFKREETKKLQKERKVFEKHTAAARAIPDKRERDEIQALKQRLSSLHKELKWRESRWSTTHSRLRQQIDSLSSDNSALRDEVRTLEKLRLSTWRKTGTDSDREEDRRENERPRPFDSNIALGARGLKSASPDTVRSSPPQSSSSSRGSAAIEDGIRGILKRSAPTPAAAPDPTHSYSSDEQPSLTRSHHPPQSHDHSHNLSPRAPGLQTESTEVNEQQELSQDVIIHPDGKMERVLACGGRLIIFPNGTRKEVLADGLTVKVTFFNRDIKQVMADQRVIYYYADAQTTHTTYPDGIEVLQFPNNQTEKHFPDGRKEITYPDQTVKNLYPDGTEECTLTDGTIIQVKLDGSKEIQFNTGQKEVHTADYKRREYPDGTLKTVYTDGRQETRYTTGRLRVKDGNVVMDNRP